MAEQVLALVVGVPLVAWAFHRVFIWPFTRNRK